MAPGVLVDRVVKVRVQLAVYLKGPGACQPYWWVGSCPRVMSLCPKVAGCGVRNDENHKLAKKKFFLIF